MAPSNPDIVWVGTGEANIFRSSQAGRASTSRSTPGRPGSTWDSPARTRSRASSSTRRTPDVVFVAAVRPRVDEQRRAWSLQDHRRRQDLGQGAVCRRHDRGHRPGDGPRRPGHAVRLTWQRIRLKWNDPRNFGGYGGSGRPQSTDGGQDVGAHQRGAARAEVQGTHRPRRVPVIGQTSCTPSSTTTRFRGDRPRKRGPTRTACPRPGSSKAQPSTARTTRGPRGRR